MTADDLIAFERRVQDEFEAGNVRGPVHLSGGNESQLIEIFRDVKREDWVFSTWRNHYHALLHGLPADWVMSEIMAGRSLSLNSAKHRFYTSAIVGGCLPIAAGVAAGIKRRGGSEVVWCFTGDMCSMTGAWHDASMMSIYSRLPLRLVIEDNGFSTETPTVEAYGERPTGNHPYPSRRYTYKRTVPHYGAGKVVNL